MTVKPRTIDNLGVESSIRYAKDQEALDTKLIQDSRFIPLKTEVSVLKPFIPTELEQFFAPANITIWALFAPPPDYLSARPLFTYQLIPSLGGYEKQEADSDKLESLESALGKPYSRKQKGENRDQDRDKERQEEEKERQILLALLKCIQSLDKTLTLINSRRNQYQRG